MHAAIIPGAVGAGVVVVALLIVTILVITFCFCYVRLKKKEQMASGKRSDAKDYIKDLLKGITEFRDALKTMGTGASSDKERRAILQLMSRLMNTFEKIPTTLNGAIGRIQCDEPKFLNKESMEVEDEVASLFATVAGSMIKLGMTNSSLKDPLKETLKSNPHLTFMRSEE